jgi:predicted MFS family arabinose efflux permease
MLVSAGAMAALAFVVLAFPLSWAVYAAAMLSMGVGFYMLHNSFQTQVTELVPDARGSAVALHAFSYFCGQALGPVVIGVGIAGIGFGTTMIFCAVAAMLLGIVAAVVLTSAQPRAR